MAVDFGIGQPLNQSAPWLRDEAERTARILDVTERNSVIEGLPPLTDETRRQIRADLAEIISPQQAPPQ